jgi:hypothetical protein
LGNGLSTPDFTNLYPVHILLVLAKVSFGLIIESIDYFRKSGLTETPTATVRLYLEFNQVDAGNNNHLQYGYSAIYVKIT